MLWKYVESWNYPCIFQDDMVVEFLKQILHGGLELVFTNLLTTEYQWELSSVQKPLWHSVESWIGFIGMILIWVFFSNPYISLGREMSSPNIKQSPPGWTEHRAQQLCPSGPWALDKAPCREQWWHAWSKCFVEKTGVFSWAKNQTEKHSGILS